MYMCVGQRERERGSKVAGVCQVSKLSGQVTASVMTSRGLHRKTFYGRN